MRNRTIVFVTLGVFKMTTLSISEPAKREIAIMCTETREDIDLGCSPIEAEARAHQRHAKSIETELLRNLDLTTISE